MFDETGCAGVSIGRGAFYDPWIFKRTLQYLNPISLAPRGTNGQRVGVRGNANELTSSPLLSPPLREVREKNLDSDIELPPEPPFTERIRIMRRHLDLMIEVFGEELGCRMFRKVAPWYAKRFGPCHELTKRLYKSRRRRSSTRFWGITSVGVANSWTSTANCCRVSVSRRWSHPSCAMPSQSQPNANRFPCRKGRWRFGEISKVIFSRQTISHSENFKT